MNSGHRSWSMARSSGSGRRAHATGHRSGPVGSCTRKRGVRRASAPEHHPRCSADRGATSDEARPAVVDADDAPEFTTSDHLGVWFDDDASRRPPQIQGVGLGHPAIEVSLPVSPRQCNLLDRGGRSTHCTAGRRAVDEINRRTRFACNEHIVVNCDPTRFIRFAPGKEPTGSGRRRGERGENRPDQEPAAPGPHPPRSSTRSTAPGPAPSPAPAGG